MAVLTTRQELAAVREALQAFASGEVEHSVSVGGMTVTYSSSRMGYLERREKVLIHRLAGGNRRKRFRVTDSEGNYL